MRPNRTLHPAFPLAVLAAFPLALLSGCADGELGPGSECESVSGCADGGFVADGGAVAVETGLSGEGNPLAYGDEDDGFRCDEMDDDCFKKCFDGPSDTCTCEEDLENEDWCCCFGEPGCDMCTGGGGGCGGGEGEGTGGGEGEEDEDEEEDEGEGIWGGGALRLDCFESRRGERGGCEVRTALDMDSLRFEWLFGGYRGEGEFYSSWRGTATETRKIGVAVTMLGRDNRMRMLTGKAVVRSRAGWTIPTRSAELEYVDPIPGVSDSAWGKYHPGRLGHNMFENVGTGPWEGTFYIHSPPRWIGDPEMYAHADLVETGKRYKLVHGECGVAGGSFINVYDLNDECGYSARLNDFRLKVVAHEVTHLTSLNKCILSINRGYPFSGRMAELERVVRDSRKEVEDEIERLWPESLVDAIKKAGESKQPNQNTQTVFTWERPRGPWKKAPLTLIGHNGTDGCPGI